MGAQIFTNRYNDPYSTNISLFDKNIRNTCSSKRAYLPCRQACLLSLNIAERRHENVLRRLRSPALRSKNRHRGHFQQRLRVKFCEEKIEINKHSPYLTPFSTKLCHSLAATGNSLDTSFITKTVYTS